MSRYWFIFTYILGIAFNKQCHRIAHKKYQFALNIIESYLAELPLTPDVQSSRTVLLFKKKLFETKRKIEYNTYAEEELVAKLSGALKVCFHIETIGMVVTLSRVE
jgi:hypothetical protein